MAPRQVGEWFEVVDSGSDYLVAVLAQEDDGRVDHVGAAAKASFAQVYPCTEML